MAAKRSNLLGRAAMGLLAVAAAVSQGTARGETPTNDEIPAGTVAFFAGGACPEGFAPADEVEGRAIVGVTDGTTAGVTVGKPLGDREDRTHDHRFTANVAISGKGTLAADGDNKDGAAARGYAVAGVSSAKTSGLAFVQVQACAKL